MFQSLCCIDQEWSVFYEYITRYPRDCSEIEEDPREEVGDQRANKLKPCHILIYVLYIIKKSIVIFVRHISLLFYSC